MIIIKRRVTTTISEKHYDILKKHAKKYETQQKVLETALDLLEHGAFLNPVPTPLDEMWSRLGRDLKSSTVLLNKPLFEELARSAQEEKIHELLSITKPAEVIVNWYYQKPLKNCNLQEVMAGICLAMETGNWFNAITCLEYDTFFDLNINHSLSLKGSRIFTQYLEDLFEAYGVRVENKISDVNIHMRIFNGK